jgi:hypothetical protein
VPTVGQKALAAKKAKKKVPMYADTPDKSVNLADKKGMGFKAAAASVARKQGVSPDRARAIIASGAQNASAKAKKANPNLKKVATKGAKKQSGGTYK